ncbi:hypothetical protein JXA48_05245 [Candidatus Woesearchaeota archaeon]|nr:hypothetical protein [Candidatus Woesearchaeota archaeon]
MGFFHKTIKDAMEKAKNGELEEARLIINEHRNKFLKDEELEEGNEVETLFYLIRDWKTILATKEDWEHLPQDKMVEYLDKMETHVIAFKRIMKRMLEEEEIVLE